MMHRHLQINMQYYLHVFIDPSASIFDKGSFFEKLYHIDICLIETLDLPNKYSKPLNI